MFHARHLLTVTVLFGALAAHAQQPPAQPATSAPPQEPARTIPKTDQNGNPLRLAVKTGHVSNYDEAKVRTYTLPDPLLLADGKRVQDAAAWRSARRPEIIKLYENEIYGRIPSNTPKVKWTVSSTDASAFEQTTKSGRAFACCIAWKLTAVR